MGSSRPDDRELDDEIRGHLALSIRERIERGESPEAVLGRLLTAADDGPDRAGAAVLTHRFAAAVVASLMPAARAARVDVLQALRFE